MPICTFKCNDCGSKDDYLLGRSDDSVNCKDCGSANVVRVIGTPSIRFRGSGFYATDYQKKKPQKKRAGGSNAKKQV